MSSVQEQQKRKDAKIGILSRQLQETSKRHSSCLASVEDRDRSILRLTEERDELTEQLNKVTEQLKDVSSREETTKTKFEKYREHINAAIEEQQDLYKQTQAAHKLTLDEVRAAELRRQTVEAQAKKQADNTSQRLVACWNDIKELQKERQKYDETTENLKNQIKDKDEELARSVDKVQSLVHQNTIQAAIQESMQTLIARTEEILDKTGSSEAQTVGLEQRIIESQQPRIMGHLETVTAQAGFQVQELKDLKETNTKMVSSITEKLEVIATQQLKELNTTSQLDEMVKIHMNKLGKNLAACEDALAHDLAESRSENNFLARAVEERELEYRELAASLNQLEDHSRTQEEHIQELEESLERARSENPTLAMELDATRKEAWQLNDDAAAKATMIAELEKKITDQDQAHMAEIERQRDSAAKLNHMLQAQQEAARASEQRAVQVAQQEAIRNYEQVKQAMQELIDRAELEESLLRDQLMTAKRNISEVEERGQRDLSTLKTELAVARSEVIRFKATAREANILKTKLARAEKKSMELEKDCAILNSKTQTILDGLRQW
ncbi:hypothetical protein NKR23_g3023 [Pleurostoma richardsiae]|uniref:Uncharacterized protein n=1 Tax=Pleurostoma richardsiae TaxID=41990 RepID=A0AA38RKE4_9PEZI|nr:hypothetical protein NKR23_g3023 [Pleurostoma richardsiae]